jgi:micrococcal nuclease
MRATLVITLLMSVLDGFCQINARVVRVKDGDTFVALWGGKSYNCRLLNVDAPELKQAFGEASSDSLANSILGKTVTLDSIKNDFYGRVLVNVHLGNIQLDSLMIRKGWAWHYANYSNDNILALAMQEAVFEGIGLWKCGVQNVCPPWFYRKYNFWNKQRYCTGCQSIFN